MFNAKKIYSKSLELSWGKYTFQEACQYGLLEEEGRGIRIFWSQNTHCCNKI